MENSTYATLTRQSGLMKEMRVIANNIANAATSGYRQEGITFSEYVAAVDQDHSSISMATANVRETSILQGGLTKTGGTFDLAIEGEGYFLVQTPDGDRLTRAGAFTPNSNGDLVTADGYSVLDSGGAPVFIPTGADSIGIAADGTISAGGTPIGQVGIVQPNDPKELLRQDGVMFNAPSGFDAAPDARLVQGFLEDSNVDPILQISRMIEVQRAYELGQSFLDKEDERIRNVLQSMSR